MCWKHEYGVVVHNVNYICLLAVHVSLIFSNFVLIALVCVHPDPKVSLSETLYHNETTSNLDNGGKQRMRKNQANFEKT